MYTNERAGIDIVENLQGLESTPTMQDTATQMKILVIPALI